jgi:anti-sigma-K factor RskA
VAAAAALVVSLGVWTNDLRAQRDAQAQVSRQLAAALERLEDPSTAAVRLESEAGDVVAVALVTGSEVELVLDGLPVNDDGTSYVLWGEDPDGTKRAVGAFDVTSDALQVRRGMQMDTGTQRLMVTHEHGNSPPEAPTLPVLAVGVV